MPIWYGVGGFMTNSSSSSCGSHMPKQRHSWRVILGEATKRMELDLRFFGFVPLWSSCGLRFSIRALPPTVPSPQKKLIEPQPPPRQRWQRNACAEHLRRVAATTTRTTRGREEKHQTRERRAREAGGRVPQRRGGLVVARRSERRQTQRRASARFISTIRYCRSIINTSSPSYDKTSTNCSSRIINCPIIRTIQTIIWRRQRWRGDDAATTTLRRRLCAGARDS